MYEDNKRQAGSVAAAGVKSRGVDAAGWKVGNDMSQG